MLENQFIVYFWSWNNQNENNW